MGSARDTHMAFAHHVTPAYFQQIDNLTSQVSADYVSYLKEITRHHWKSSEGRSTCFNRSCRRQFSFIERTHHCRKCGEVFCAQCVAFRRRLNRLAHFDPDGDLEKVCQVCFDKDKLSDGQTRNHTQDFFILRKRSKERLLPEYNTGNPSDWRNKVHFERECERLVKGFEQSIGNSEIKRTFHEVKSFISTPDWMKSSVWILENMASNCQLCLEKPSWLSSKLWCRVCGMVTCSNCSSKDLLLFVPDGDLNSETGEGLKISPRAQLAVIKIVGCPAVEPDVSLYLRVCRVCKEKLVQRQIAHTDEEEREEDSRESFLEVLVRLDEKFHQNEERVRNQLPKYKEVAESLEDSSRMSSSQGNMKTLAKAQEDLADVLAQHITVVQKLKQLRPSTDSQSLLLRTYIKAKCAFYLENMSDFRAVKHKLSESVPAESLDFIQRIMDKNAIISTHLYLRQLVYETIYLCGKYSLEETIPSFLMEVEANVESDVATCLKAEREDVAEHMDLVKEMIKSRLKTNRLIRPSKRALKNHGSVHVQHLLVSRTVTILSQVNVQLQLAAAHRSFNCSKDALKQALVKVEKESEKSSTENQDFVFVDKF
ncbi:selenium-binding protein 1-like protein [Plakobranchus ocellatus]|uniref:Selenium-binding protein 1-like protein n=1 Tax=Plakobranchus ocellatus TaxID=259542 RepID=A0AAV3XUI6_9GAST|nr:selenium-binding protein 1-like protein [Plakobranchus ocellatus]